MWTGCSAWGRRGGSRACKRTAIERLVERRPELCWVLLGDDGGHDPDVFVDVAQWRPDRVALIALRQVLDVDRPKVTAPDGNDVRAQIHGRA